MTSIWKNPEARWFVAVWFAILLVNFALWGVIIWAIIELVQFITAGSGV